MIAIDFGTVAGLTAEEKKMLDELVRVYCAHRSANAEKEKYYEGHVTLQDVNLGIALPQGIRNLEVGCSWGQKAVDVLAARSMFDGFVSSSGSTDTLTRLIADNRLIAEYGKACRDELKYGCAFATLSADSAIGCRIRFHSPATAAALWSGEKGRIACGMAVIDTVPDENYAGVWQPRIVNLYTDKAVLVLRRQQSGWIAQRMPHRMGRPLMEPMIWNATSGKPFGRSRLKRSIRTLIDDYIRTVANATIALEFDTTPQKYILGVTDAAKLLLQSLALLPDVALTGDKIDASYGGDYFWHNNTQAERLPSRGGAWSNGSSYGVFSLIGYVRSHTNWGFGGRCAFVKQ